MDTEDIDLINKYLTIPEKIFFQAMDLPTQKHCVRVARMAIELAYSQALESSLLVKAALLHDIGKISGDLGLFDRTLNVILDTYWPSLLKSIARRGKGNLISNIRHAAYIYYNHPFLGANKLQSINADKKLVELVRNHQKPPSESDSKELALLKKADNMY